MRFSPYVRIPRKYHTTSWRLAMYTAPRLRPRHSAARIRRINASERLQLQGPASARSFSAPGLLYASYHADQEGSAEVSVPRSLDSFCTPLSRGRRSDDGALRALPQNCKGPSGASISRFTIGVAACGIVLFRTLVCGQATLLCGRRPCSPLKVRAEASRGRDQTCLWRSSGA